MVVPGLVVPGRPLLDALLGHVQGDVDPAVLAAAGAHDAKLDGVQGMPGVPAGDVRQKVQGILLNHRAVSPHAPIRIIDRLFQELPDSLHGNGLQLKDDGSGQQCPVDLEVRVLRGGPYQYDSAVFHKGQQIVLLGLVEAMDLIDEKDGALAVHPLDFPGLGHHFLHVLLSGHSGVDLGELGAGGAGDDLGQSGLARARRAVEDDGADLVRLDGPVEQLVPADDVLLPRYLIQGPGAHPGGQGSLRFHIVASHIVEYVHVHSVLYRPSPALKLQMAS